MAQKSAESGNREVSASRKKTPLGKAMLSSLLLVEAGKMLSYGYNSQDFYNAGSKFLSMNKDALINIVEHPYLTFTGIASAFIIKRGVEAFDEHILKKEIAGVEIYEPKAIGVEKIGKFAATICATFSIPALVSVSASAYNLFMNLPKNTSDALHGAVNCVSDIVYVGAATALAYSISKLAKYAINAYYNLADSLHLLLDYLKENLNSVRVNGQNEEEIDEASEDIENKIDKTADKEQTEQENNNDNGRNRTDYV